MYVPKSLKTFIFLRYFRSTLTPSRYTVDTVTIILCFLHFSAFCLLSNNFSYKWMYHREHSSEPIIVLYFPSRTVELLWYRWDGDNHYTANFHSIFICAPVLDILWCICCWICILNWVPACRSLSCYVLSCLQSTILNKLFLWCLFVYSSIFLYPLSSCGRQFCRQQCIIQT